jgi:glycolate oxidase
LYESSNSVGTEKLAEMSLVFRQSDIETMRGIKAALDPKDLCNPGKVIPPPAGTAKAAAA